MTTRSYLTCHLLVWGIAMRTCESCFREHNGRGRMCPQCNNPGRVRLPKNDPRKENDRERVSHMDLADQQAAANESGWFYEDEDDE